jgi:hypothetical protein
MGVRFAWVLLPVYFRASSRRCGWRLWTARSVRNGTDGRDGLVAVGPRLAGGRTRAVVMSSWGGFGQGLPFLWPLRATMVSWPSRVSVWTTRNSTRSAREISASWAWLRKKMAGGITASHGRDTDADEVQRSKELIVMGRRTRKLSVQCFTFVTATKRSLAKASIDPRFTSLLDSEDLKVMSTDQEWIHDGWLLHIDFSRTLTTRENFYFYCFHLARRKGIDATRSSRIAAWGQVDRDSQKTITKKGTLIKEFHSFLYEG